jgi:nicotinamide mononucleotide transporter
MTSTLELAANGLAALAIFLAGRNHVHSWSVGIVGCVLFGVLFYQTNLYADVALQFFFIGTNIIGLWKWTRGGAGGPLVVSHANFASLLWTVPVGIAATAGYGAMLHFTTNAYAPFADSAVLVFSVIAQVLLMQRRIENWAFWIVVNGMAAPLYASRGLYLTAVLYTVYFFYAIVSWHWWRKLIPKSEPVTVA